jgi:tRNA_anti-like
MKRIILILLVIVILAGGWYAYRIYTGKVKSLTEVKTDVTITAKELIAAFEKDSAAANKQYLGKVIEVTGNVKSVEKEEGTATVSLGENGTMSSVRCSMDTTYVQQAAGIQEGSAITVKGACTGFISEELIGSDVILNRCIVTTSKK